MGIRARQPCLLTGGPGDRSLLRTEANSRGRLKRLVPVRDSFVLVVRAKGQASRGEVSSMAEVLAVNSHGFLSSDSEPGFAGKVSGVT